MAEANQFTVDLTKLTELLIKDADVHDGEWSLLLGLQIGVGSFGIPGQQYPGAAVTLHNIGIQKFVPGNPRPEGAVILDAAKVNPKKKSG